MLNKLVQILINHKDIDEYKIVEKIIESSELFYIKKFLDMKRVKKLHYFIVTIYINFKDLGNRCKGSATTNIHPTMSDIEIEQTIIELILEAKFIKNPFYPLVNPITFNKILVKSKFSKGNLEHWTKEISNAIYKFDIYKNGGINSCEIYLNKIETRIINTNGLDVSKVNYQGIVELISYWNNNYNEVELYRCLNFSNFNKAKLSNEVKNMILFSKEKAYAKNTPMLENIPVLLTYETVKKFFNFYYEQCNASSVFNQCSNWKIGDKIQGEFVNGDLITMTLNPFMNNSNNSEIFDEDGYPLDKVIILDKGVLRQYISNIKYAYYLNIKPTGSIVNVIVCGGSKTLRELKCEPYIETVEFSDFKVDKINGNFFGEIRLARFFDGERLIPIKGGSVKGNIIELHNNLYLSKELQKDNNFEGPKAIKLYNVTIAGID